MCRCIVNECTLRVPTLGQSPNFGKRGISLGRMTAAEKTIFKV